MNKQQEIDILSHLISIKSVNDHEAVVAGYIESLFKPYEDQGVKIERVSYAPDRDNLIVTIGEGERMLGFSGHEDVVAPGDLSQWNSDPFKATIKDNMLYGRGASDMKSGLAALIAAILKALSITLLPPRAKVHTAPSHKKASTPSTI